MAQIMQKIPNSQKSWQNLACFPICPYTKEHAWQPGNKATWLPCHINLSLPMQMVMVTFCLIHLQIAQHAICPEYNTIFAWISYIKGDFTLPSPSSCSFRWATCGAFPLSFAASWGCIIIGWVLDCCLC